MKYFQPLHRPGAIKLPTPKNFQRRTIGYLSNSCASCFFIITRNITWRALDSLAVDDIRLERIKLKFLRIPPMMGAPCWLSFDSMLFWRRGCSTSNSPWPLKPKITITVIIILDNKARFPALRSVTQQIETKGTLGTRPWSLVNYRPCC